MQPAPPSVVVVAYGAPDLLRAALDPVAGKTDVVVVDNSSSPEVAACAEAVHADYVDPGSNEGYACGVNRGLAHVGQGRDVLLLNPDARISWEDVLHLQAGLHGDARTAAVAPTLVGPDGRVERTVWPLPTPGLPWQGVVPWRRPHQRCFLNGAVLLLNGAARWELGGFDERFFLYAEESDWQRRAIASGWTVKHVAEVVAQHQGGATSGDREVRDQLFHSSADLYVRKWFGAGAARWFQVGSAAAAVRRLIAPGLWRPPTRRAQLRALRIALRRRPAHSAGRGTTA